jgi:anti-sigma regulatory factor (Ser/Thr protein kinase)
VSSDPSGLAVRQVRRGPNAWVLAVSGELSLRSAGLVSGAVAKALAESGRVLVDVSGLRVTWPPAVQMFPSVLAGAGGWPGARLVLFGADAGLARSLAALRVSATVPVAPDEVTARRLLDQRPRAVARHLDLEQPRSAARRARTFVRAACADWRLDDIRDDATIVASELVDNAVLHAGTVCRLTLRYTAFGLTIEVRDDRPDRVPEPPPVDPEPPQRLSGLFMVATLTREWGIMPRTDDKTVWALLPIGDPPTYARAIRKAVHDAVRAVLAHGRNTTAAAAALRQITARLTEQYGVAAARDLTDELARELAAANSAVAWINNGEGNEGNEGNEGKEHNGRDTRFDGADTWFDDQHRPNPGEPGTP